MLRFVLISIFVLLAAANPVNITSGTTNGTNGINSINGTNGINSINGTKVPMWMGDVPGHGYVELHGDAHAVLKQIFALNPALREDMRYQPTYNPFMSPQPRPLNESDYTVIDGAYYYKHKNTSQDGSGLAARGLFANHEKSADDGYTEAQFYCGTFATGVYYDSYEAIAAVQTGQNGYWKIEAARSQDPLKPTCMRLACSVEDGLYTNTAVYWCNDNPYPVTALAPVLAAVAGMVASGYNLFDWSGCCQNSQNKGTYGQFSGQIFIGNGTNINVGWGDCSVPDYFSSPSQYPYPGKYGECS